MKKLLVLCVLLTSALSAQNQAHPANRGSEICGYVQQLQNVILGNCNLMFVSTSISDHSLYGSAESVATAEELIKRFDVARPSSGLIKRNVELTCYILIASPKGTAGEAVAPLTWTQW